MWKRMLVLSGVIVLAACGGKTKSSKGTAATTPPPVAPYGGAGSYPGSTLNPDVALNGMGQWVYIGNQRFFVPSSSYVGADWVPYQNGYWMFDNERGWTWVSNDRFGWMTDHYGIWRHHNRHGWVWMPFHDLHYEAHGVSWFDQGENSAYLGWYPYNASYSRGYVLDNRAGFDDGFWRGDRAVLEFSTGRFSFGLSLVSREDACERNLRRHLVRDNSFVMNFAFNSLRSPQRSNYDARFPGGHRDRSFGFVQVRARTKPVMGEARYVRSTGGARFLQPQEIREHSDTRRIEDARREHERGDNSRRVYVPVKRDEVKPAVPVAPQLPVTQPRNKREDGKREDSKRGNGKREEIKRDDLNRDDTKPADVKDEIRAGKKRELKRTQRDPRAEPDESKQ